MTSRPRIPRETADWSAPFRAIPGAQAWKVLYHSRAVDGSDVAVSGVVVGAVLGSHFAPKECGSGSYCFGITY